MKGNTKITKLVTSNFCRVSFVSANFDDVTVIAGENGQGKTSFLNSLIALFDGNKVPDHAVRTGTDGFKIVGTFEDETGARFYLTRQQKAGGTQAVSLTREDGQPIPQPATAIKSMLGAAGIAVVSPMEFAVMDKAKQGAILRKLAGVDTSEVDAQIAEAEDLRKEKNAVKTAIKARMSASDAPQPHNDVPAEEINTEQLRNEYAAAMAKNESIRAALSNVERLELAVGASQERVRDLENQLATAKSEAAEWESKHAEAVKAAESTGQIVDVSEIESAMAGADAVNAKVREHAQWSKLFAEWTANEEARVAAETELDRLKSERVKLFNSAQFAVEGLTLGEDGEPLMNGLPLTSASEAEKILIACEIAMASAGQFKGMAIRGAQAMTSKTQAILIERARERGAQLFLEIPEYEGNETTIVLEDGEVAGQQPKLTEVGA